MIVFKLKKLLFDRNMRVSDLARKTGLREATLGLMYHGYIKRIHVQQLDIICRSLNCELFDLIEYIPDEEQ